MEYFHSCSTTMKPINEHSQMTETESSNIWCDIFHLVSRISWLTLSCRLTRDLLFESDLGDLDIDCGCADWEHRHCRDGGLWRDYHNGELEPRCWLDSDGNVEILHQPRCCGHRIVDILHHINEDRRRVALSYSYRDPGPGHCASKGEPTLAVCLVREIGQRPVLTTRRFHTLVKDAILEGFEFKHMYCGHDTLSLVFPGNVRIRWVFFPQRNVDKRCHCWQWEGLGWKWVQSLAVFSNCHSQVSPRSMDWNIKCWLTNEDEITS